MARLLLCVAAVLALAGCGAGEPTSAPPEQAPAQTTTLAAGDGPDISGAGLDNEALSATAYRGKPLFVNVWSSW